MIAEIYLLLIKEDNNRKMKIWTLIFLICFSNLSAQVVDRTPEPRKSLNSHIEQMLRENKFTNNIMTSGDSYNLPSMKLTDSILYFPNLQILSIVGCDIKILPKDIGRLNGLRIINLIGNKINCLPNSIGDLDNLTSLEIGVNEIDSLPASVIKLKKLKTLVIGNNKFTTFPCCITKLVTLETLSIKSSRIDKMPEEIVNLINLKTLDFSMCDFKTFPPEVLQLKNIEVLIFYGNKIKQLPDLSALKKLRKLYIDKKKFDITNLQKELPDCDIQ